MMQREDVCDKAAMRGRLGGWWCSHQPSLPPSNPLSEVDGAPLPHLPLLLLLPYHRFAQWLSDWSQWLSQTPFLPFQSLLFVLEIAIPLFSVAKATSTWYWFCLWNWRVQINKSYNTYIRRKMRLLSMDVRRRSRDLFEPQWWMGAIIWYGVYKTRMGY